MENLMPGIWKLRFGTPEEGVPSKQMYVKPPLKEALEKMSAPGALPFKPEEIKFSSSARGTLLEIPISEGEDLYGFGLQLKSLRQTGKKRTLRVNSDPVADTGDSHAPAPLYFSTAGYGILVDTARYASFYCGGNQKQAKQASQERSLKFREGTVFTEAELYAANEHSAAPVYVEIPVARGVDVFVFAGPSLLDAVRRYILFCGGGCLPPEWGLGVWYRTCGTHSQKQVESIARELRDAAMPCDVLGLEPGWHSRAYSCSYVWSEERFPNPGELLKKLRGAGYHVNLWEHCFVHPESPIRKELEALSGDFAVWQGLVPDFTLKKASEIFAAHHRENLVEKGVSSFKLDECDNSDFIASPWSFPECSKFPSGLDGEQMHSLLGLLYQATIEKACREGGARSFGSVRSSHAFAAPWPFVLYSDLYKHEDFIRGVAGCGFSGMLWTPELRAAKSKEDYARRLQAMVLAPQMLLNIWNMPNPPWEQLDEKKNRAGKLLPAAQRKALEKLTSETLRMRMSFIPYLHAAYAAYRFEGIPPFRALPMDYPADKRLRNVDWAWLAGPDLLVAPFTADSGKRVLPLPEGEWFDFYTGKRHSGEIALKPAQKTLPIFVKGGAVIPFAKPVEHVEDGMKFSLELRVYGDGSKKARLFAEDGYSFAFEKGAGAWGEIGADGAVPEALASKYEVGSVNWAGRKTPRK